MMNLMQAIRCRRTGKLLSRYLDMDPDALLSREEIVRVRAHLAECEKCTSTMKDMSRIKASLRWIGESQLPDQSSLSNLRAILERLPDPQE